MSYQNSKIVNCELEVGNYKRGFSLVEALLAGATLTLLLTAVFGAIVYGEDSIVTSGERSRAVFLAEEGLEAARNIKDAGFQNLTDGTWGLASTTNIWSLAGLSNNIEAFDRSIQIASLDSNTKTVTSIVTWQPTATRSASVSITARFTNWQAPASRGMLVHGSGGIDSIVYRKLLSSGVWSAPSNAADIDTGTTNKALLSVSIYASATRDEKIIVSRHYNGSAQFIYAQAYNGITGTWGNVVALSNWTATTFLDVKNFSGTYLNNGDFMAIYSDNTTVPKFRIWNGVSWGSPVSLPNIGGIPNFVVAKARPGHNEVMAAFFDQSRDTNSAYFNGGAYIAANWTLHTEHSAVAPVNTKRLIDFDWSPNNSLKGGLVYSDNNNDKAINIKIWTANGTGGGSWSATANTTAQVNNLGSLAISGRPNAPEFIACDKDAAATPLIICYKSNFTPAWINPTNPTIVTGTDTGIQRSFDAKFESGGNRALSVYSDTTAIPKLKRYLPTTSAWDVAATSLPGLLAALETSILIPDVGSGDIMILLGDTSQNLYSAVWDSVNNTIYSSPTGKAFTSHSVIGATDENFWFDFAWDQF